MGLLSIGSFFETEFFDRELPAFSALPNTLRAWEINFGVGLFLLAVIVAVGVLAYRRLAPEKIARELFRRKVFSPDGALSCAELAVKHSLLFRFSMHNRLSNLRRCVLIAGEAPLDLAKKSRAERKAERKDREKNPFVALKKHFFPDLSDARFYLDPERAEEVERRYVEIRGVTPRAFVWTAVVSVVLFFVLCRLMPSILGLIDNIIG